MKLAGAWPGEDLNVAKTDAFPLGGKRILIDDDFADRLFVRQSWTGSESVNKFLCTARSRCWASERALLCCQFVRIVGLCV